jgi:hypothetical protein
MIHIVFQESDVAVLQNAFALDDSFSGQVIQIKDDFAVGPLFGIDTSEGWANRENWWRALIEQSPYSNELVGSFDDRITVKDILAKLSENEDEEAWIWMGGNAHDVCGYFWLVGQLKAFTGRIKILYLNNLPFINEKGNLFYPTALHEIQPKEFLKARKLCRNVTLSEFEIDPDEWKKMMEENATVRILEGGKKITGKDEDFYDEDVLNGLTKEWQRGNRAMHNLLAKMKIKTGNVFLLWRMYKLAESQIVEINGDPAKGWKDFEVRLKTTAAEAVETNQNEIL